jgi:hypothetical protein
MAGDDSVRPALVNPTVNSCSIRLAMTWNKEATRWRGRVDRIEQSLLAATQILVLVKPVRSCSGPQY